MVVSVAIVTMCFLFVYCVKPWLIFVRFWEIKQKHGSIYGIICNALVKSVKMSHSLPYSVT